MNRVSRRRGKLPHERNTASDAPAKQGMDFQNQRPSQSSESRSLFHYTDAAGLTGIIQSQSFFATHANFLNDSAECKILTDLLSPKISRETEVLIESLVKIGLLKPEVKMEAGISSLQAEALLAAILQAQENISPIYICSFCLHARSDAAYEDGLLSQWRGYGNAGFAIELDEFELDKIISQENKSFRYQGILTNVVHYDEHAKHAKLERFDGLAAAGNRLLFENAGKRDEIFGTKHIDDFVRPLLQTLPFMKHSGFSEEQEYRIAALCNRPGIAKKEDTREERKAHFRTSATGSVIPFIKMFDGLRVKLPIKSILVGPHRNQDNQATALRLLLDQYEIQAEVRRSKLTFRET